MDGSVVLKLSESWMDFAQRARQCAMDGDPIHIHLDEIRRDWKAHAHQMIDEMLELAPLIVAGSNELEATVEIELKDADVIRKSVPSTLAAAVDECIRWGSAPPSVTVSRIEGRYLSVLYDHIEISQFRLPASFVSREQAFIWRAAYSETRWPGPYHPAYFRRIMLQHRPEP